MIVSTVLAVRVSKVVFVLRVFLLRDSQTHNSTNFLLSCLSGHKMNFRVQTGRESDICRQLLAHYETEGTQEQFHGAILLILSIFHLIESFINEQVTESQILLLVHLGELKESTLGVNLDLKLFKHFSHSVSGDNREALRAQVF